MNSSINKTPTKVLCISNCSNDIYKMLKLLVFIKKESMNQICCDILFNFKESPYMFINPKELLSLKTLIHHILITLDIIGIIEKREIYILNLAYLETSNLAFKQAKNQILADKSQISKKNQQQYITLRQLWNMFSFRHASVENMNRVKKHLLKISKYIPISFIHPKKPLHELNIYVPTKLYNIIKYVCNIRKISFHTLFTDALLKQHLLPKIIPTKNIIHALPKGHKSLYQNRIIKNYIFYQDIKKSLLSVEHEDLILCNQYKTQYHTFLFSIKHLFKS